MKINKYYVALFMCFFIKQAYCLNHFSNAHKQDISNRSLHNISVFNKVYGYIRHFSPTLAVDTFFGWEDLLLKHLPLVENAKTDKELSLIIQSCFSQLEPNLVVEPYNTKKQLKKTKPKECNGYYVHRLSKGWGNRNENATKMKFLYTSNIERCGLDNKYFAENVENIHVSFPLSICINDSVYNLYNKIREFDPDSKKGQYRISDKYVRIGIIMIVWNVQEYFYPYLNEMNIDNDAIFKKYLKTVSGEMNEQQFFETLEFFGAEYKDGHAGFMPFAPMAEWPDFVPPIKIQLIENILVVTYISDSLKHLINLGDQVVSIDGVPAMDYFKTKLQKVSSATQTWNKYISESELLSGYKNTVVKLELLQKGIRNTLSLNRNILSRSNDANANKRPDVYEIKKDYFYVNLFNLNDSVLNYMNENYISKAKGVIFDCRGYPKGNVQRIVLPHLLNDTIYPMKWSIPVKLYPQQKEHIQDSINASHWVFPPLLPRYTDNVVFIVNARNISAAESILSIVEHYKLGTIVGEQTAGTNGNINSFILFGLYQFWQTQMHTAKHDGANFHGVGIIPQVQVKSATLNDLIEGKDMFVIEALKMLR